MVQQQCRAYRTRRQQAQAVAGLTNTDVVAGVGRPSRYLMIDPASRRIASASSRSDRPKVWITDTSDARRPTRYAPIAHTPLSSRPCAACPASSARAAPRNTDTSAGTQRRATNLYLGNSADVNLTWCCGTTDSSPNQATTELSSAEVGLKQTRQSSRIARATTVQNGTC